MYRDSVFRLLRMTADVQCLLQTQQPSGRAVAVLMCVLVVVMHCNWENIKTVLLNPVVWSPSDCNM